MTDCIVEMSTAWTNDVTTATIAGCFKKPGSPKQIPLWNGQFCIYSDWSEGFSKREERILWSITLDKYIK